MLQLYLTRHGRTAWNTLGRFQGLTDVPLDALGREQTVALAASLRGRVEAIVSSDLSRASESAERVAEALSIPLLWLDADLRERGYGVFEGLTRAECQERYPEAWAQRELDRDHEPPGGEPRAEVLVRVQRGMERTVAAMHGRYRSALVMGHGSSLRMFLQSLGSQRVDSLANLESRQVVFDEGGFLLGPETP